MKVTVILLAENNGVNLLTKDCLRTFVKKNKFLKSQLGQVSNIRYNEEVGKVFGDIEIPFRAAVNGTILSSIETPSGQKVITEFKPKDVTLFIGRNKK